MLGLGLGLGTLRKDRKPLMSERSGTQCVAVVTKVLTSYCGGPCRILRQRTTLQRIKQFRCKLAEIFVYHI